MNGAKLIGAYSDKSEKPMFWNVLVGDFGDDNNKNFSRHIALFHEGQTKTDVIKFYQSNGLDVKKITPVSNKVFINCMELLDYCDDMRSKK